ncbi:MAG: hypothetical protein K0S58_1847 [Nitrospira sp.]|jgi:hypothetical protein|nr:hypothetical protein [Nitrospira sp.]
MSQFRQIAADEVDRIDSFCAFGMKATKTLQALCHLLGSVEPTAARNASEMAADLAQAVNGMLYHLQVIEDAFDNINILGTSDQEQDERTEAAAHTMDTHPESALTV